MGMKRTSIYLDEDILFLAGHKGLKNLSDFVRQALESFVLDDEDYKIPNPIHEKARLFAEKMKHELRCQKKIISEKEAATIEVQEYQQKRYTAIENACLKIFLKHRNFSRILPENDPDSERFEEFEHAVSNISLISGYDVDPAEVIRIYRQKTGTKYTGTREVEAPADGIPFYDEEDERPHGLGEYLYRRDLS